RNRDKERTDRRSSVLVVALTNSERRWRRASFGWYLTNFILSLMILPREHSGKRSRKLENVGWWWRVIYTTRWFFLGFRWVGWVIRVTKKPPTAATAMQVIC